MELSNENCNTVWKKKTLIMRVGHTNTSYNSVINELNAYSQTVLCRRWSTQLPLFCKLCILFIKKIVYLLFLEEKSIFSCFLKINKKIKNFEN